MKKKVLVTALTVAIVFSTIAQTVVTLPQASQKAIIGQTIGLTDITIEYYRPAVKGRKIWGEIVPYGFTAPTFDGKDKAPWKTGANMSTTISFTHNVKVEGNDVKAGKYGLFVAVNANNTATLVLSRTNGAYGHYFYKQEEDVLRADVSTKIIPLTELFTCSFDEVQDKSATLSLKWETLEIPVRISVDVNEIVTASLIEQLKTPATFSWHGRVQAARYLVDNNTHLDLAMQWVNEAINGSPGDELMNGEKNFYTLTAKYNVLYAMSDLAAAKEALKEALTNPGYITPFRVASFGRSLITKNRKEDAQLVTDWALKKWPDSWESKHAMARLLSFNGKYKEALKYEREVLTAIPAEQKKNIEANIKLLEDGKSFN